MKFKKETKQKPKSRPALIPPKFILGMGDVMLFGSEKYDADNWKLARPEEISLYKDALMRHILAYLDGEQCDPETGLSHLYHAGCNLSFLDHFDRKVENETV